MTAELDALVALMPFAAELVLVLVMVEASAERVVAELDWAPRLCTAGGLLHGGVLMSLADSVYDDRERLVAQTTRVQTVR
jgi:acyl-coenzyme A thioesterase PaaI-like protein